MPQWEEVKTLNFPAHKTFRFSCPNHYKAKGNRSQNLAPATDKFLVSKGINGIIESNENEYDTARKSASKMTISGTFSSPSSITTPRR